MVVVIHDFSASCYGELRNTMCHTIALASPGDLPLEDEKTCMSRLDECIERTEVFHTGCTRIVDSETEKAKNECNQLNRVNKVKCLQAVKIETDLSNTTCKETYYSKIRWCTYVDFASCLNLNVGA